MEVVGSTRVLKLKKSKKYDVVVLEPTLISSLNVVFCTYLLVAVAITIAMSLALHVLYVPVWIQYISQLHHRRRGADVSLYVICIDVICSV